ncbi:hypothetical protein KY290_028443 [Solanum tuberosum]|uniref:Ulp1 protease family, C-terminal catalytic domain containing protein n=1 Tax=Solanum tuberosum TaxID=4113 RepID=A0ABQ7UJT4_SOLTU|nr:hypothetical protein KY290_028443 [Solanum tuberosum]
MQELLLLTPFFISWVVQIYDAWEANGKDEIATDYYALRKDIDWNTDVHYAGRDCGLYTCAFAEYVCRGDRNVSMSGLNAENLRLRFGALLWEYEKMKIDTESISEDEASNQGRRSNRRVKE